MPPIGFFLRGVDFTNIFIVIRRGKKNSVTRGTYKSLQAAIEDGAVTVKVGVFFNALINFIIISGVIFTMIRTINKFKLQQETITRYYKVINF